MEHLDRLRARHAEAITYLEASDDTVQTMARLPLNFTVTSRDVKTRVEAALALNRQLARRARDLADELRAAEIRASRT